MLHPSAVLSRVAVLAVVSADLVTISASASSNAPSRVAAPQAAPAQQAPSSSLASPRERARGTTTEGSSKPRLGDVPRTNMALEDALRELDRQNPGLQAARARVEAARGMLRQVRAALHPTLVASGNYVRNSDEVIFALGGIAGQIPGAPDLGTVVIQPLDAWTASAALRVPIVAPHAWYDAAAAEAGQKAAELAVEVARGETRAAFAKLAHSAIALEEMVSAAERAVRFAGAHRDSAARRAHAGTAAPLDLLRAETEVVHRESDLTRAKAQLARARLALGVLLGRDHAVRVVPDATVPVEQLPEQGSHQARPELRLLDAQAEASRAQVRSAKSRVLPELAATAAAFASDEPYPTQEHYGWKVGLELTIPLYDGGYRYGKRREAEAGLGANAAEREAKRLNVAQEVADARRDMAVSDDYLRLSLTRRQLAEDAAASATRSYAAGIASTLDVIDANDRLYQAEVAVADARAQVALARIELARALGVNP